jgi:hypothetical protein
VLRRGQPSKERHERDAGFFSPSNAAAARHRGTVDLRVQSTHLSGGPSMELRRYTAVRTRAVDIVCDVFSHSSTEPRCMPRVNEAAAYICGEYSSRSVSTNLTKTQFRPIPYNN